MGTPKQDIEAMLRSVPDNASFDDIQYKLFVLDKIHNGRASFDNDGGISHTDLRAEVAAWLTR
jgi:hypothetical protein